MLVFLLIAAEFIFQNVVQVLSPLRKLYKQLLLTPPAFSILPSFPLYGFCVESSPLETTIWLLPSAEEEGEDELPESPWRQHPEHERAPKL